MSVLSFRKQQPSADLESLLENELDGLYRVALRFTRDAARAEDLVHDTAVRALRFRDRFEPGTNFRAWIYTVLTNTFIHRYRRQKREREILEGTTRADVDSQLVSEGARQRALHPEHAYLDHLLSDEVLKALDALPEDFRTAVVLCDIEGLSYRDIADVMGCPVGTVMSRLYRGRGLLESRLAAVAAERGLLKGSPGPAPAVPSSDAVLDINRYRRRRNG